MIALDEIYKLLDHQQIITEGVNLFDELIFMQIGVYPYPVVRQLQNGLVDLRKQNKIPDTILFCEHPPVVTSGLRECLNDSVVSLLRSKEIEVIAVDRGGMATYHAPGQIIIYPVVSLRRNNLGVRTFVNGMLASLATVLVDFDINARAILDPAGVWVSDKAMNEEIQFYKERKIAAVGLRIKNGITNHGFSLNYDLNLKPYNYFTPCGLVDVKMTSIANETLVIPNKEDLIEAIRSKFYHFLS